MTGVGKRRNGWAAAMVAALLAAALLAVPSLRAAEDVVVAKPESVGMSSERLQRIDSFIQEYIDADRIAGAVTLVARKGEVVHFEAQGWRDKEKRCPDDEGLHLRPDVDDQADRLDGADDAVRGGAVPARRPDLQLDSRVREPLGAHQPRRRPGR